MEDEGDGVKGYYPFIGLSCQRENPIHGEEKKDSSSPARPPGKGRSPAPLPRVGRKRKPSSIQDSYMNQEASIGRTCD
jgi:hypothetical protein